MAVNVKADTSAKPSRASGSTGRKPSASSSTATSTTACSEVTTAPGHRPAKVTSVSDRLDARARPLSGRAMK